ncbi:MAG: CpsD/CapB family tyrosine-protein kinase [Acidobacteriia bacterium]|nr:CpsD/CapB family tyrosine-protein kinase [Terriglobia bacterium]
MSEIFSWLRRAELEKRKERAESVAEPAALHPADQGEAAIAVESEPVLSELAQTKIDIRNDARFDLAAADQRIRSVLDPLTAVGEQYRLLRARLSILQKERGMKTLLVTSSVPVEGKTFTACCLAGVFAQEPGRRVLLIDADLRKPKAAQDLGMKSGNNIDGLSQVLRGEKTVNDVLLGSSKMDFFLLPAGPVPDDPAELLSSPNLERAIKTMAAVFDWVVIDSPPALALADATLIAPLCDAALLVVRTDKTPSKLVQEAIKRIGRARICGLVMNRGRHVKSSHYYYYHYYRKDRGRRQ